jgi:hypothetical protein
MAVFCKYGDEPAGSGVTDLVILISHKIYRPAFKYDLLKWIYVLSNKINCRKQKI